jgi:hypothetical protein
MPLRIDDGRPISAPTLVMLADGTVFVSWLEHYNQDEAALWLRRVSRGAERSVPVLLATLPASCAATRLQLALLAEEPGSPGRLLLAYPLVSDGVSQVVTRLLSVSPPPSDTATRGCASCPPADEAARGHALRAHIVSVQHAQSTVVIRHGGIAGVLPAGSTECHVPPELFNLVAAGSDIFARIERREKSWRLFDVRLIVSSQTGSTGRP